MGRKKFFCGVGVLVVAGILCAKPAFLWVKAWLGDRPVTEELPPGYVDDASRMNATHVAEVWSAVGEPAAMEVELRGLLLRAQTEGLKVAIGGARHSMGGHTISPNGIVLDMLPCNRMELSADKRLLTVGSGARWSQVISYLNEHGLSVAIMQSNNNFSVGGSISVNCHGWQHNKPPIASTVESLRLMKADGVIVHCSRDENAELFSLVLGGYGLFGVILDVNLRVVPNERYHAEVEVLPADQYVSRFAERTNSATDIGMAYGRLCVVPGEKTFLREALLTVFRRAPCKPEELPALTSAAFSTVRREVFRAQIGSDSGKEIRWKAEKAWGEQVARKFCSRNQLLNEEAGIYQEHNADRTDILHEYFVPSTRVSMFLERVRRIIPKHHGDLLNVTIRNALEDKDCFLRYADQDVFAFVMLFNQPRTSTADSQMEVMTRELIDAAIECGGRYYLPYRLHATKEQFFRAYPQAATFFERKRQYDPAEIFQNQFYMKYGRL